MFSKLYSAVVLFAQQNGGGDGGGADGGNAAGGNGGDAAAPGFFDNPLIPSMILIMVLFYFIFMRPQSKARREKEQALKALKKNDKVITIGGIHGVVVSVHTEVNEVVIRVDENNGTKIKMSRAAIHEIIRDGAGKGSGESSEKTATAK